MDTTLLPKTGPTFGITPGSGLQKTQVDRIQGGNGRKSAVYTQVRDSYWAVFNALSSICESASGYFNPLLAWAVLSASLLRFAHPLVELFYSRFGGGVS